MRIVTSYTKSSANASWSRDALSSTRRTCVRFKISGLHDTNVKVVRALLSYRYRGRARDAHIRNRSLTSDSVVWYRLPCSTMNIEVYLTRRTFPELLHSTRRVPGKKKSSQNAPLAICCIFSLNKSSYVCVVNIDNRSSFVNCSWQRYGHRRDILTACLHELDRCACGVLANRYAGAFTVASNIRTEQKLKL